MPTAEKVVADLSSQSSRCVRPVFRGAVQSIRSPACSVIFDRSRGSADARFATGERSPTLNAERVNPRSAQRDRSVALGARRVASVPGGCGRTLEDGSPAALPIQSPPHQAWVSPWLWPRATQEVTLVQSRARFHYAGFMTGLIPRPHQSSRERFRRPVASSFAWTRF